MKNMLNRFVFDQVNFDSGVLITKSSIVHPVYEPGEYQGSVRKGEEVVGSFSLTVSEESAEIQASIDLYTVEIRGIQAANSYKLSPRGCCVFYVSSGAGGYKVELAKGGKEKPEKVFDTRELTEGDVFTATLIRPGVYAVKNQDNGPDSQIVVPYPKRVKRKPDLKPLSLESGERGIIPSKLEVQAGCGIMFHIKGRSRISIELKKPIDRPDLYRTPEDIPRSVERRSLAVINSVAEPEYLATLLSTGKSRERDRKLAEKIMEQKKKTGRIAQIEKIFELVKFDAEEMTSLMNSLEKAYGELTRHSGFRK